MFKHTSLLLTLAAMIALPGTQQAHGRGNDLVIKDGFGEELVIKNGWFGRGERSVKDRLGNKYVSKKGWFGGKQTEVNVLGNTLKSKKGILGGSDVEGKTILGDSISSKKGLFGRRTTTVDVSGMATALRSLFSESKSNKKLDPFGTLTPPSQSGGSAPGTPSDIFNQQQPPPLGP